MPATSPRSSPSHKSKSILHIILHHGPLPASPYSHGLQRWTGKSFERYSLYDAGLTMQLGHDGGDCRRPHSLVTVTIVDLLCIHRVRVAFCDCGHTHHFVQMLRAGWWPASLKRPRTGFTIRTLEFFQALSLLSKTNGYDFWKTIVHMTDGAGVEKLPVSLCSEIHRHSWLLIIFVVICVYADLNSLTIIYSSKGTRSLC